MPRRHRPGGPSMYHRTPDQVDLIGSQIHQRRGVTALTEITTGADVMTTPAVRHIPRTTLETAMAITTHTVRDLLLLVVTTIPPIVILSAPGHITHLIPRDMNSDIVRPVQPELITAAVLIMHMMRTRTAARAGSVTATPNHGDLATRTARVHTAVAEA